MLSLAEFHVYIYIYILVEVKVTNTRVTKFREVVKYCTNACSCIVLTFYTTLGAPSLFLPLVKQKGFEGFLVLLIFYFLR